MSDSSHLNTWFIFQNDQLILAQHAEQMTLPTGVSVVQLAPAFIREHAIGQFEDRVCYCAELPAHFTLPAHLQAVPLRQAFEWLGDRWYGASVRAYSIINWDKNHQFCGRCAAPTIHQAGLFERRCSACGLNFYPRISPSIIVLIQRDDHILMARSPHFTSGVYGLIAGFVEAGESLEETAHREVKEEVGIEIKNLTYFGSQAWPFPDSLMVGFFAEHARGEIIIDPHEIEAAGWYRYDQLPKRSLTTVSISRKLIDHYLAGKSAADV